MTMMTITAGKASKASPQVLKTCDEFTAGSLRHQKRERVTAS